MQRPHMHTFSTVRFLALWDVAVIVVFVIIMTIFIHCYVHIPGLLAIIIFEQQHRQHHI